jgi:hypothetical protein
MSKRVVVEVREDLHKELRKLAVLNDLKIYELVNAIFEDCLSDEERLKLLLKNKKKVAQHAFI